jgi:peptidoglycan/xylan/chitin deacetylase (PgdA/CDA1 family)
MGFDIGGHTMNHANLAAIPLEEAQEEIRGCRQMLTDKLQTTAIHFAYPFGGRDNISQATRQMVQDIGFTCCFSCHGGLVSATDDAFDLRREPINGWVASPYQYGFELLTRASEGVS